jgi:hypothetical protein
LILLPDFSPLNLKENNNYLLYLINLKYPSVATINLT